MLLLWSISSCWEMCLLFRELFTYTTGFELTVALASLIFFNSDRFRQSIMKLLMIRELDVAPGSESLPLPLPMVSN